ncbi:MAG: acyltransferase, partial [Burkholderiaceae bacterium]|nr:acyltransferase [Burkholderiaceae bacterium]
MNANNNSELHGWSKNIGYIPALHHLRCLAAFLVFAHHYIRYYHFGWTPQPALFLLGPITEGYTGVGLFFALSGYLFTTIALNSKSEIHYKAFVKNRMLRIVPLYGFVFALAISLKPENLHGINVFDFLLSNLGSPVSSSFITGAAWTISIEFAFYLLFPFLVRFSRKEILQLIGLILIAKFGIFLTTERANFAMYASMFGRFDQFLIGMLAAYWAKDQRKWLQRNGRWMLALSAVATWAALACLARFASNFGPAKNWAWLGWPTLEALLWSAVIVAYVAKPIAWPKWLDRILQRGGEISYSLYMLHFLAIVVLFSIFGFVRMTGSAGCDL